MPQAGARQPGVCVGAPDVGHLPGDRDRPRCGPGLGAPMAGQGCEELETGPAVVSLRQGLMALGGRSRVLGCGQGGGAPGRRVRAVRAC